MNSPFICAKTNFIKLKFLFKRPIFYVKHSNFLFTEIYLPFITRFHCLAISIFSQLNGEATVGERIPYIEGWSINGQSVFTPTLVTGSFFRFVVVDFFSKICEQRDQRDLLATDYISSIIYDNVKCEM